MPGSPGCEQCRLRPVGDIQPPYDLLDMRFDRAFGHGQRVGDKLVRLAFARSTPGHRAAAGSTRAMRPSRVAPCPLADRLGQEREAHKFHPVRTRSSAPIRTLRLWLVGRKPRAPAAKDACARSRSSQSAATRIGAAEAARTKTQCRRDRYARSRSAEQDHIEFLAAAARTASARSRADVGDLPAPRLLGKRQFQAIAAQRALIDDR